MLSTGQAAQELNISPARVRALIARGQLRATKIGRGWLIDETDVARRLEQHPHAGRPAAGGRETPDGPEDGSVVDTTELHDLYLACKRVFEVRPDTAELRAAKTQEEASFYMAVSDFFIKQKQIALVNRGVF